MHAHQEVAYNTSQRNSKEIMNVTLSSNVLFIKGFHFYIKQFQHTLVWECPDTFKIRSIPTRNSVEKLNASRCNEGVVREPGWLHILTVSRDTVSYSY